MWLGGGFPDFIALMCAWVPFQHINAARHRTCSLTHSDKTAHTLGARPAYMYADLKQYENLSQRSFPHTSPHPSINRIFSLKQPELLQHVLLITKESHVIMVKTVGFKVYPGTVRVLYVNFSFLSTWMVRYPVSWSNSRPWKNSSLHYHTWHLFQFSLAAKIRSWNWMTFHRVFFNSRARKLPFPLQLESVYIRNT